MPEATVYEHRDTDGSKDDVRLSTQVGNRPDVYAVTQAKPVQRTSQVKFTCRVSAALMLHAPVHFWR